MYAIVDRVEGEYAVLEIERKIQNKKLSELPAGIKEGDVLLFRNGKWVIDEGKTSSRRDEINKLIDEVWED